MKTYTDKQGKVYAIVPAAGEADCTGCDFYKDKRACREAPDCGMIIFKEISEEKAQNETKEETVSTQGTQKKAHKHSHLIKLWANGEEIQYFDIIDEEWVDCTVGPAWDENTLYRIKPEEKKPVVRWLWAEKMITHDAKPIGWGYSNMFASEEEAKDWYQGYSVFKLEWTRTEFPE